jgi:hypothetical protein
MGKYELFILTNYTNEVKYKILKNLGRVLQEPLLSLWCAIFLFEHHF